MSSLRSISLASCGTVTAYCSPTSSSSSRPRSDALTDPKRRRQLRDQGYGRRRCGSAAGSRLRTRCPVVSGRRSRYACGQRPRLIRLLLICVVALALAGCNGGTVDRHALTNDGATLNSIACEGALLASDVARGRTTTYFARVQAEVLRIESSNLADALSHRKALPSIEQKVREKLSLKTGPVTTKHP